MYTHTRSACLLGRKLGVVSKQRSKCNFDDLELLGLVTACIIIIIVASTAWKVEITDVIPISIPDSESWQPLLSHVRTRTQSTIKIISQWTVKRKVSLLL